MRLASIFYGRVQVVYSWGRYGWTRGGGKTWHGGIDLVGLDDKTIHMPYYKGKKITGKVVRARIVLDHSNKTWEWGYYVCVQLDADQTPDAVNFLYFCHCSSLLVQVGQKVSSGDALAVMGRTGNAALGDCPYDHCHLEVRATATGRGLDPTAYAGCDNAVGVYGTAEAAAPTESGETVIDAYCGTGTISLCLAKKARRVIGIEIVREAIEDAKKNAAFNHIENAEFHAADAGLLMPKLYEEGLRPDVIVMDPVRAGCSEDVLKAAAGMQPARIVYVSCNPATFARDAEILGRLGHYKLQSVQPVDMFPQTTHVETVALLTRTK